MDKQDYFSVRHREIKQTTSVIRWVARIWILFCMLAALSLVAGVIYFASTTTPADIGHFLGEIAKGFEEVQ